MIKMQLLPALALLGFTLVALALRIPPLFVKAPVVELPTPNVPVMVREPPGASAVAPRFPRIVIPPLVTLTAPPLFTRSRAEAPETDTPAASPTANPPALILSTPFSINEPKLAAVIGLL